MSADAADAGAPPNLFGRVRSILVRPRAEWARIAVEPAESPLGSHVLPLAAAGALAGLIGALIEMDFSVGAEWSWLLAAALLHVVLALLGVALTAWIAERLAPRFGAEVLPERAAQLAGYAATAFLLAGLAQIVPLISPLVLLAGGIYSIVLYSLGARVLLPMPEDRVVPFVLSVLAGSAFVAVIAAVLINPWIARGREALIAVTPSLATAAPEAAEQARERSQAERALERLLQTYGRQTPIDPARLVEQLPQTLPGGFALTSTEGSAVDGMAQARGEYASGEARLTVNIAHVAALSDATAAARSLDVADAGADGYVRRENIDGRLYMEHVEADAVEYAVIGRGVAMRVEGAGGVTIDQARAAIETIGLQRLERQFGN
jgi:MFS family permease